MLESRKFGGLSTEKNSLFLGNLPKDWSPDEFGRVVRQAFPDVASVDLVMLSSDGVTPFTQKQQNRGFGFVQFSSHAAAERAYRLSSRSDFLVGGRCHPSVQWAKDQEPELDPEELSKVKIGFIRNLPSDVNEGFLKKLFGPYGETEKIVLSKKGLSQVGFIHYAKRQDLDIAIKEMNNRIIHGLNSGPFKLQVEVARPFEKSKKRTHEGPSSTVSQPKVLKPESRFTPSSGHVLKVREEQNVADPYEAAVVSLPATVQDRLLRILRLGIATRYDIDIQCLRSLKELPEPAARSVLDQFLLSGGDEIDKGAFLAGLINKYQVRSLGSNQLPEYKSRAYEYGVQSDLAMLPSRNQLPAVDPFSSHMATSRSNEFLSTRSDLVRLPSRNEVPMKDSFSSRMTTSRYERYPPPSSYLNYLSPQAYSSRTLEERKPSPERLLGSSPSLERVGIKPPLVTFASRQTPQPRVRFDPFTGEPYKFDPYTGEPIQPDSLSRGT